MVAVQVCAGEEEDGDEDVQGLMARREHQAPAATVKRDPKNFMVFFAMVDGGFVAA